MSTERFKSWDIPPPRCLLPTNLFINSYQPFHCNSSTFQYSVKGEKKSVKDDRKIFKLVESSTSDDDTVPTQPFSNSSPHERFRIYIQRKRTNSDDSSDLSIHAATLSISWDDGMSNNHFCPSRMGSRKPFVRSNPAAVSDSYTTSKTNCDGGKQNEVIFSSEKKHYGDYHKHESPSQEKFGNSVAYDYNTTSGVVRHKGPCDMFKYEFIPNGQSLANQMNKFRYSPQMTSNPASLQSDIDEMNNYESLPARQSRREDSQRPHSLDQDSSFRDYTCACSRNNVNMCRVGNCNDEYDERHQLYGLQHRPYSKIRTANSPSVDCTKSRVDSVASHISRPKLAKRSDLETAENREDNFPPWCSNLTHQRAALNNGRWDSDGDDLCESDTRYKPRKLAAKQPSQKKAGHSALNRRVQGSKYGFEHLVDGFDQQDSELSCISTDIHGYRETYSRSSDVFDGESRILYPPKNECSLTSDKNKPINSKQSNERNVRSPTSRVPVSAIDRKTAILRKLGVDVDRTRKSPSDVKAMLANRSRAQERFIEDALAKQTIDSKAVAKRQQQRARQQPSSATKPKQRG